MAVDMFLQIEGIAGESTDSNHPRWIEILSYSHAVVQPAPGGAPAAGRAEHSDFAVVKRLDSASPAIFEHVCSGKVVPTISLELCRAIGEKTCFMRYILQGCTICSCRPSGHSQGEDMVPLEEISFRYAGIRLEYTPTDTRAGGKTGPTIKSGWSTIDNKPL